MLGFFIYRLLANWFLDKGKSKTQFTMLSITLYFIWYIFVPTNILMIKKLLLLFITLITLINVSYASFPIIETRIDIPIVDTISNTESIDAYHLRMQKMGFDLSSCKCESCRAGIPTPENIIVKTGKVQAKDIWAILKVVLILLLIIGILIVYSLSTGTFDIPLNEIV